MNEEDYGAAWKKKAFEVPVSIFGFEMRCLEADCDIQSEQDSLHRNSTHYSLDTKVYLLILMGHVLKVQRSWARLQEKLS